MGRKERVEELWQHHKHAFIKTQNPNAHFDSKAVTTFNGKSYIGFFESQLKRGDDIYFEINDFQQGIIDNTRQLYRLKYNPHFTSDYMYKEDTPAKIPQYYIELHDSRIEKISHSDLIHEEEALVVPEELEDTNISELTARDHACILLKVAESKKKWLNDLINKAK